MANITKILSTLTATIFIASAPIYLQARSINVRGTVTHSVSGEPLQATIYDAESNKLIGVSNHEGKYTVTIDDTGELSFVSDKFCEDKNVQVKGRLNIDVQLDPVSNELDEVIVEAKGKIKAVLVEPSDIEVSGNYLLLKTRVKVPHGFFSSDVRLIIQPKLYNITRNKLTYLNPKVFDGKRYAITQERLYDFDANADPLHKFVKVKTTGRRTDDYILVQDSAYVENPDEDYRFDIVASMENYNRVFYNPTFTVARGVVNPLRFLDYSIGGSFVTDSAYFPEPEMQLRDTGGDVSLTFKVGRTELDLNQGNNRAEMESLLSELHEIEKDPDATLKSFTISGTASPEGRYEANLQLAKGRIKSAMSMVLDALQLSTRTNADMNTNASVETWAHLAEMLRTDGKTEEADIVQEIVDKYPNNLAAQYQAIKSKPFYNALIVPDYLPQLRKVSYRYISSRYRYLTDEEIKNIYASGKGTLTRYEYWRLYTQADSLSEKETIIRRALKDHPKFIVAATDLAAIQLIKGTPDENILQPFLDAGGRFIPNETRLNQALAHLANGHYLEADSLSMLLPDEPKYHKAKIYTRVLNGHFEEVIQEISEDSPINEVVLLLAIKANDRAWEKAKNLGTSAREHYIKAIAANRVDQYIAAINNLKTALKLDPSLIQIAEVDGDMKELLQDVIKENEDNEKSHN